MRARVPILFSIFLCVLAPALVDAAALNISMARSTVSVGESFTATILVSSADQSMNAVSGVISFPKDALSVTAVSKLNSILTLWVQDPTYSNIDGTVNFSGVIPNPGWTGLREQIVTIQFRALKPGAATVEFSSSAVLANDGNGTNILTAATPGTVSVTEAQKPVQLPETGERTPADTIPAVRITSSTHPDQNAIYRDTHVVLDWTNHPGTSAVRIGYNKYATTPGVVVYDPAISHKEIDLENGTWYFHVQERTAEGWGSLATFAIHVDTAFVPPVPVVDAAPPTPTVAAPIEKTSTSMSPYTLFAYGIPLIAVALALILLGWELARSFATPRSTARHVRAALHKEFNRLKDSVVDEIQMLEKIRYKRSLTKEEERLVNRLSKLIERTERDVEVILDETS